MKIPLFGNGAKRKTAIIKRENIDQILEEACTKAEQTDAELDERLAKLKEKVENGTLAFKFQRKETRCEEDTRR